MQVEVSKHTEGSKDKMVRPNGLPESLIRYDGKFTSTRYTFTIYKSHHIQLNNGDIYKLSFPF